MSRASIFVAALSGAVVALALVAQATELRIRVRRIRTCALAGRLLPRGGDRRAARTGEPRERLWVQGMNRIRQRVSRLRTGARAVLRHQSVRRRPGHSPVVDRDARNRGRRLQAFVSVPGVVAVIDSVVAGADRRHRSDWTRPGSNRGARARRGALRRRLRRLLRDGGGGQIGRNVGPAWCRSFRLPRRRSTPERAYSVGTKPNGRSGSGARDLDRADRADRDDQPPRLVDVDSRCGVNEKNPNPGSALVVASVMPRAVDELDAHLRLLEPVARSRTRDHPRRPAHELVERAGRSRRPHVRRHLEEPARLARAPMCSRPRSVMTRPRGVRWRKPSCSRYGS